LIGALLTRARRFSLEIYMAKILARALTHITALGVACGHLIEGPDDLIKGLGEAGLVDPHPDAVAYGKSQGVPVVKLADPQAAAELAEAMKPEAAE
jgi:hypothetical protein